jgi:photosystem II stability/assembly factor-like uncharacterized protein
MRVVFTTSIITILISSFAYSQYFWDLKQSGSSLGGPIDVEKNNANNVYYGSGNIIYKSNDRGETFFPLGNPVPDASSIKNIILNDENPSEFLVAIGTQSKILKTTNAGTSWNIVADSLNFSYFGIPMSPDPSHPGTVYTVDGNNVMRSTNFGDSWVTLSSVTMSTDGPCDIEVFPDTSVILIGDNGTGIFRSTDYGLTWAEVFDAQSGEVPTIAVAYQNTGIAWATRWGGGGGLLKSTDYGATWDLQGSFDGSNMWGIHVLPTDANIVIAGCYSCGTTWRTKNGGQTWGQINISSTNYQIFIVDSVTQFAAQGSGFYKLDSPYFVPVELTSFTATIIDNKAFLEWATASEINNQGFDIEISYDNQSFEKVVFVSGFGTSAEPHSYSYKVDKLLSDKNYFRLRQVDFDGAFEYSSIVEVDGVTPSEFYLAQNHPNPFNPSTSIQFSLPVDASVKLSLFNMLGEEVIEIANKDFSSGVHTINFSAERLSSGTYFYLLEAVPTGRQAKESNGIIFTPQTKKMLLLK